VRAEHRALGRGRRVTQRDAGGEPVPLRLGQRVGALHLDRVLGGDDHERRLQRIGRAIHGDLTLAHALEQCRLGLRRGPVDLVAQHDVGEHRSGLELEVATFLVEGAHPGDVAGQQIRGELDPLEDAVDRAGQGLRQHRLAHARHVLDEQVPLGQQHGQGEPDRLRLSLDHGLYRPADPARRRD